MSEQTHLKDWYVAQVLHLTNENKRLVNEAARWRRRYLNVATALVSILVGALFFGAWFFLAFCR